MTKRQNEGQRLTLERQKIEAAKEIVSRSLLGPVFREFYTIQLLDPNQQIARISLESLNLSIRGSPGLKTPEWAFLLAMASLHLALGHYQGRARPDLWSIACAAEAWTWACDFKIGTPPHWMKTPSQRFNGGAEQIYQKLLNSEFHPTVVDEMSSLSMAGDKINPFIIGQHWQQSKAWLLRDELQRRLVQSLIQGSTDALAGSTQNPWHGHDKTEATLARKQILDNYPLLGALASSFTIIEDWPTIHNLEISVAAVNEGAKEIYINPGCGLDRSELVFVLAHEMLHVGLRHASRCQGRDFYLWNIACDYVINDWLLEMAIGTIPRCGLLFDKKLRGQSAEAIYDLIVKDLRKLRKLATFAGTAKSDILAPASQAKPGNQAMDLDEFYRRALSQGLQLHRQMGRGSLPAGLEEEIVALLLPAIPWDVQLSHWFDSHFPPLPTIRSYGRANRRQSATPDIPRPSLAIDPHLAESYVFGVVLDTSGSMTRHNLSKALGTIAGFAQARMVRAIRVIHCDADVYDMGYLEPTELIGRVSVLGRGGTILQPAIDLLQKTADFPLDAPILVITDGFCDILKIRRDHAFLLPQNCRLPFAAQGKVFYM